jgi:NAD(P)-dependent dehydrogenase (short-subunit alcohol dehydrogenase family)
MTAKPLRHKTVVVVGGSEGIGRAVAEECALLEAKVVVTSRSLEKAQAVAAGMAGDVLGRSVDTLQEESVRALFSELGEIDHLVVSASEVRTGSLLDMPLADAEKTFRSKFFGPLLCVRQASIRAGGSITLFSGILSRKPSRGYGVLSSVNAAVEALGRTLALELAPIRVNTISPGLTRDTAAFNFLTPPEREALFASAGAALPVGRVGLPRDVALATIALMTNEFTTGTTLEVDGGALLT